MTSMAIRYVQVRFLLFLLQPTLLSVPSHTTVWLFVLSKEVMENGMTEKQKIFADEYIICLNATQAYKKAYPHIKKQRVAESAGSRLLSNVEVKAYIDEQLEKLQSERVADQQEVLEFLTAVMRGEVTEPLLVLDGDGMQRIVEAKPNVATRKSAAVDLGKRYGLLTEKVDINATVTEAKKFDDIVSQLGGEGLEE